MSYIAVLKKTLHYKIYNIIMYLNSTYFDTISKKIFGGRETMNFSKAYRMK